jgi:nucleoid-associated protein YgaU
VAADGRLVPQDPAATRSTRRQATARTPRPRVAQGSAVTGPPPQGEAADRVRATTRTAVRLTRRGRLVVTAAAALAIGAASIAVAGAAQATGHSGAPAGPGSGVTRVEIRPGESLWSVAEAYDPNADTRVVIEEIVQMNSLVTAQVQPGQVLWVPRD